MAFKQFEVNDVGTVTVYKRAGAKSLRLSIRADGSIRVTIPTWTPYAAGVTFAKSRTEWIKTHARPTASMLASGQLIGKSHRLVFVRSPTAAKISSRVKPIEVVITYPVPMQPSDAAVQKAASAACIRALRSQSERLLPLRLRALAAKHDLDYKSVVVKQLKTRWGSCDQNKNIILNLFLMQLPWELIDYVLLHELTHTRVMQHGPKFWQAMEAVAPGTSALRKQIRSHQPVLSIPI